MSDWDEQTEQKAGEVFPDPGAKPPTAEYPLAALRHGKRGAYVLGAKWQREQLRTDEAVERGFYAGARWQREQLHTAEAIERTAETLWSTSDKRTSEDWAHEDSEIRKYFIDSVEEFSTALLGED